MVSQNVKEFLAWSKEMDHRVKQAEQEEIQSEKFSTEQNSDFVLQNSVGENRNNFRIKEGALSPLNSPIYPPHKQKLVSLTEGKL